MSALAIEPEVAHLSQETLAFYRAGCRALAAAEVPFLVGGAYAFGRYTGIQRHTKDFDIFVRADDAARALEVRGDAGWQTELTFPHWLGKAYSAEGDFIDVIFSSGNGVAVVDDEWFAHAVAGEALGIPVWLCPPEEMIWSKGFILERERYDGADIAHLIRAGAETMDWARLLRRFGEHWRVLYAHLCLFGFIYPSERDLVPRGVMEALTTRLRQELVTPAPPRRVCQGTLVSREQYLVDVEHMGYADARLDLGVRMNEDDIAHWTRAIPRERPAYENQPAPRRRR